MIGSFCIENLLMYFIIQNITVIQTSPPFFEQNGIKHVAMDPFVRGKISGVVPLYISKAVPFSVESGFTEISSKVFLNFCTQGVTHNINW